MKGIGIILYSPGARSLDANLGWSDFQSSLPPSCKPIKSHHAHRPPSVSAFIVNYESSTYASVRRAVWWTAAICLIACGGWIPWNGWSSRFSFFYLLQFGGLAHPYELPNRGLPHPSRCSKVRTTKFRRENCSIDRGTPKMMRLTTNIYRLHSCSHVFPWQRVVCRRRTTDGRCATRIRRCRRPAVRSLRP